MSIWVFFGSRGVELPQGSAVHLNMTPEQRKELGDHSKGARFVVMLPAANQ
jgi:hypothetical protein